jgi:hypothetical protein
VGDEFLFHIYACAMRVHEQSGLQYEIVCFLYLLFVIATKSNKKVKASINRSANLSGQRTTVSHYRYIPFIAVISFPFIVFASLPVIRHFLLRS